MFSNSKLDKIQKAYLKEMAEFNPQIAFAIMGKTTIAFKHVGDNVEFATAIRADNEKKNRPNVGKYFALNRFENGQTVKMPFVQFDNMVESAFWD
jgi:hypothetical protein